MLSSLRAARNARRASDSSRPSGRSTVRVLSPVGVVASTALPPGLQQSLVDVVVQVVGEVHDVLVLGGLAGRHLVGGGPAQVGPERATHHQGGDHVDLVRIAGQLGG